MATYPTEYNVLGSWTSYGVPDYLDSIVKLEPDLLNRVFDILPNNVSLPDNSPAYVQNTQTKNIIIKSDDPEFVGTDVYVTFISENADYKNVVGYFVYPLNDDLLVPSKLVDGVWTPMTFDDKDTVDGSGKSILYKTIIFPNASTPGFLAPGETDLDGSYGNKGIGKLLPGSTVKLLYDINNSSSKFPNNTGIGFFIVPDGWNQNDGTFTNSKDRIYTYNAFNQDALNQTVLLLDLDNSDDTNLKLVLTFEDIIRNDINSDSDFNDIILGITCTPSTSIKNLDDNPVLPSAATYDVDSLVLDRTGMYYRLTPDTLNAYKTSPINTFTFRHNITITNKFRQYETLKNIFKNLVFDDGCIYVDDNIDGPYVADEVERTITVTLNVDRVNLQKFNYLFTSYTNRELTSPANPFISALAEFQNIYIRNDQGNITNYSLAIDQDAENISTTDVTPVYKNLDTPYAMGDPHIVTIYGKRYDLPNNKNIYELYNDGELFINAKLDTFYMNVGIPVLEDLTFLNLVSIQVKNEFYKGEYIIANMLHPDCYCIYDYEGKLVETNNFINFKTLDESDIPDISLPRRVHYSKLAHTNTFKLKYINFNTKNLGNVYLEIFLIPHVKDFVNSVSIISNNLGINEAKGALVHRRFAKVLNDLIYKNL